MTIREDEAAIRSLLLKTAFIGDEKPLAEFADVYTDDAQSNLGGQSTSGLDAVIDAARTRREAGTTGPNSGLRHLLTTMSVEVNGDTASSVSYLVIVITKDPAAHITRFAGMYKDELRRTPEGWRIASRVLA